MQVDPMIYFAEQLHTVVDAGREHDEAVDRVLDALADFAWAARLRYLHECAVRALTYNAEGRRDALESELARISEELESPVVEG